MTRGWTPKRDERVVQVKERRVIKERNKGDENSETWVVGRQMEKKKMT